jgi:hypothetical protein
MRHGQALRRHVRAAGVVAFAAALSCGGDVAAEDATSPPYFSERFADLTWIDRIAAGPDGSVCIAGRTMNNALPAAVNPWTDGAFQASFVSMVDPSGHVRWTRYLPMPYMGGLVGEVRVAPDGAVWTAETDPDDFGHKHDVVRKLGPDGQLLFTQSLAGSGVDVATGLALTSDGDAVVVGMTTSADFPVLGAFQPRLDGDADGFVARVRGDGSGIAWSSYLGGPGFDNVCAVAIDDAGDLLVSTRELAWDPYLAPFPDFDVTRATSVRSAALTRISGDGVVKSTSALGPIDPLSLAVAADGRVIVGGEGASGGFVISVDPATAAISGAWREPGRLVNRVAVAPDGSILACTDRDYYDHRYPGFRSGGFVHLASDLSRVIRRVDREDLWGVTDVAIAPDGALCVTGRGGGATVQFNERIAGPFSGEEPFVARLPSSGVAPPSRVRVAWTSTDETLVSWSHDGDPVVGFDVERRTGDLFSDALPTYRVLDHVSAAARSARVRGHASGQWGRYGWFRNGPLRLVAVFASGVRSGVVAPTRPAPPVVVPRVTARLDGMPGVLVEWSRRPYGEGAVFDVERSVGDGPFAPVTGLVDAKTGQFRDVDASIAGQWVTYRVRAIPMSPLVQARWKYAAPVLAR